MGSSVWGLPAQGDLSSQLSQGNDLFNQAKSAMQSGDPGAMLGAGITLALGGLGSSTDRGAQVARTLLSFGAAIASGAAVGGPFGAVVGAIGAAAQLLGSVPPPTMSLEPSQAAKELYQLRAQWVTTAGGSGPRTGQPQGWSFANYLLAKYPPSTTKRAKDLYVLQGQALVNTASTNAFAGEGNADPVPLIDAFSTGQTQPNALTWTAQTLSPQHGGKWDHEAFARQAVPVCTAVLFGWYELTETDLVRFESQTTPGELSCLAGMSYALPRTYDLWQLFTQDTVPLGKLSVMDIVRGAEARRPDPMYFHAGLYCYNQATGFTLGGGGTLQTVVSNLELATMLATVLGMLAVGASTRAIVSELLLQQQTIYLQSGRSVPYGCRMLVEDYLRLAHEEVRRAKPSAGRAVPKYVQTTPLTSALPLTGPDAGQSYALARTAPPPSAVSGGAVAAGLGVAALAALAGYKYLPW